MNLMKLSVSWETKWNGLKAVWRFIVMIICVCRSVLMRFISCFPSVCKQLLISVTNFDTDPIYYDLSFLCHVSKLEDVWKSKNIGHDNFA